MKIIKFFLFLFLMISFFSNVYSISVCGVSISTSSAFIIKDSFDNNILVIDSSGNIFMQGQSHTGSISSGFKTGNNEFSYSISKTAFDDSSQDLGFLSSGDALIIENSAGTPVTKLFNTGYLETKGKLVAEGSQANCNADGWNYCNADGITRENRDYSCDITGTESGSCVYGVSGTEDCSSKLSVDSDGSSFRLGGFVTDYTGCSGGNCISNTYSDYCSSDIVVDRRASGSGVTSSSFNCNLLDYVGCSGSNRQLVDYTCGGSSSSGCTSSSSIIETCSAPTTSYGTWSCSSTSTAQRVVTSYAPTCSVSGSNSFCGSSSSTGTQVNNCPTSDVCRPTAGCSAATFSWKTGSYGSCNVACGSGSKSRSVWCEREDGLTVSDSYCGGGKPSPSTSCSVSPANLGSSCSRSDSCGSNSGTYVCNGAQTGTICSAAAANFEPWNYGNSCSSSSNICGASTSGSITCGGSCSASTPSLPWNQGNSCSSSPNSCGMTNSGTYNCGVCSASTPSLPWNQGNSCISSPNSCGMTNSGTYNCGSCTASTPSNSLCPGTWVLDMRSTEDSCIAHSTPCSSNCNVGSSCSTWSPQGGIGGCTIFRVNWYTCE